MFRHKFRNLAAVANVSFQSFFYPSWDGLGATLEHSDVTRTSLNRAEGWWRFAIDRAECAASSRQSLCLCRCSVYVS
jgi:hypothetical protein